MLSYGEIIEAVLNDWIDIEPFDARLVQPASVDLRLGSEFRFYRTHDQGGVRARPYGPVSARRPPADEEIGRMVVEHGGTFILGSGDFCLAVTMERIRVGSRFSAQLGGKSTYGRLGTTVHVTAGFIDPGFDGYLTLEMVNFNPRPIELHPGDPIAQISFTTLSEPAMKLYGDPSLGSHYQGQTGTTPAAPLAAR